MGWLHTRGFTRQDMIRECVKDQPASGDTYRTVAHRAVGNQLWTVQVLVDAAGNPQRKPEIVLFLLRGDRNFGWGYKDMTESMFPYYFDCPLAFLGMAPETSADWRDRVRARHEALRRGRAIRNAIEVGSTIVLSESYYGKTLKVVAVRPIIAVDDKGGRYRVPPKAIASLG